MATQQRLNVFATSDQSTLFAQATQILASVTRQAAYDQTGTATELGTFATAGPSLTPTITLTPTPIAPLAQQVGFSDPELTKLEAERTNILHDSLTFSAYGHRYRLLSIYSSRINFVAPGGAVVLYQMDGPRPRFLWKSDYGLAPTPVSLNNPPPGDWNGDGKIYFAYSVETGGNGWGIHSWYYIYELRPDGTVVSPLKYAIAPYFLVGSIERKTGYTALLANELDISGYRWFTRYYRLEAGQIVDDWEHHVQEYTANMSGAIYHATTAKVLTNYDEWDFADSLYEILFTYEAMEQREAGWLLVQDLVSEAKQTHRLTDGTYVDTPFMTTMTRLYKENRTFVLPPVDFSRPEVGAYDNDN
jgi:hypothetical protein